FFDLIAQFIYSREIQVLRMFVPRRPAKIRDKRVKPMPKHGRSATRFFARKRFRPVYVAEHTGHRLTKKAGSAVALFGFLGCIPVVLDGLQELVGVRTAATAENFVAFGV